MDELNLKNQIADALQAPEVPEDLLERTVNDTFGDGLLAIEHYDINKLGDFYIAELRIGQNLTLGYFATTGHIFLFSLSSV